MKILAVDDDRFILELVPMIVAQTGLHEVEVAQSGIDALNMIEAAPQPFDCFLFDIQMPGMDGIDLCRRVRSLQLYRQTPIIMLTAMTERTFIEKAFAAGATDYATKPFDVTELRARLGMADRLVQAARQPAAPQTDELNTSYANAQSVDGADELNIALNDNITELVALGNYLIALSASAQQSMQVFAVKANGFVRVLQRASAAERNYILAEIASSIHLVMRPHGYLMAYAGQGTFICVSSMSLPDPEWAESEIQASLDEKDCVLDNGAPVDIVIAVGHPIQPGLVKAVGVESLFGRVVSRAEARAKAISNAPEGPNIRQMPNVPGSSKFVSRAQQGSAMKLTRLVYTSTHNSLAPEEVDRILQKSRANNARDLVTGALVVGENYFMQLIEGSRLEIGRCFMRIMQDKSHYDIQVISCGDVEQRLFQDWSMHLIKASRIKEEILSSYKINGAFNPSKMSEFAIEDLCRRLAGGNWEAEAA